MLSFVDTRILLLLAVTSYLASCQRKFDYLLFFLPPFSDMDFIFSPLLEDLALGFCLGLTSINLKKAQSVNKKKKKN